MKSHVPSEYLTDNLQTVLTSAFEGPVLDLACGAGQNGLLLAEKGALVHFWDRDRQDLRQIESTARDRGLKIAVRHVDIETGQTDLLPFEFFSVIMVFRYLHRPLIPEIKKAVLPGGIVVYETFTVRQAKLGKPSNPDYLLKDDELFKWFSGWEILDQHQGRLENPERYMARIIARKPFTDDQ